MRNFCVAALKKTLKNFPFGDSILKDFGVINPAQGYTYSFDTVKSLATQFPQLELTEVEALDQLQEELMDFTFLTGENPSVETYKSPTGDKPMSGVF